MQLVLFADTMNIVTALCMSALRIIIYYNLYSHVQIKLNILLRYLVKHCYMFAFIYPAGDHFFTVITIGTVLAILLLIAIIFTVVTCTSICFCVCISSRKREGTGKIA